MTTCHRRGLGAPEDESRPQRRQDALDPPPIDPIDSIGASFDVDSRELDHLPFVIATPR
jgi:hypothetical protein